MSAKGSKRMLAADLDLLPAGDLRAAIPGEARPPAPFHERPMPSPPAPAKGVKEVTVATTFYLVPEDHRRLRMLAAERGVAAQTVLMDALDLILANANQPPLTRWETRRKAR